MTVTLHLTPDEARQVEAALDLYSRLQMGQFWIVADYVDCYANSAEARLAFTADLHSIQHHVTGTLSPGMAHYPTPAARERSDLTRDVYEHLRYARTNDPNVRPLRYHPRKVTRDG